MLIVKRRGVALNGDNQSTIQHLLNVSLTTILQVQRNTYPMQREIAHFPPSLGHHHSKFGRNAPLVQQIALNFAVLNSCWEAVLFKVSYLSCTAAKLIDFSEIRRQTRGKLCTLHWAVQPPYEQQYEAPWRPIRYFTPNLFSSFLEIDGQTRGT